MPETDLQKHAIIESFLQRNFSSEMYPILTMGDNLEFHKMAFYGLCESVHSYKDGFTGRDICQGWILPM